MGDSVLSRCAVRLGSYPGVSGSVPGLGKCSGCRERCPGCHGCLPDVTGGVLLCRGRCPGCPGSPLPILGKRGVLNGQSEAGRITSKTFQL